MACVLTQFASELNLSSLLPIFRSSTSSPMPSSPTVTPNNNDSTNHNNSEEAPPPPPRPPPSQSTFPPRSSSHYSATSTSTVSDSLDSPPVSPSLQPKSPLSSSSSLSGNSCHQCKTAKDASLLLFCTSAAEKGVRKRRCRKKYCESCLRRSYNPEVAYPSAHWVCPSCLGFCVCAACSRGEAEISKEKVGQGLQTLAGMNPVILQLLGIDERKLAHLQAVVNSPTVGGSNELLQMMGIGQLSMQDLSLTHTERPTYSHYEGGEGQGYAENVALQSLRSTSTTSTVSSPYASSSSNSNSTQSSPLLRSVINGQVPSPGSPLLPLSAASHHSPPSTPPNYSPRLVSRAHTHAPLLSPAPPHPGTHPSYPRLLSQPPLHSCHVSCSLPTPSRHLESLEAAYQHPINRKRSHSQSHSDDDTAGASVRLRFHYPQETDDFHPVKLEDCHTPQWSTEQQQQAEMDLRRRLAEAHAQLQFQDFHPHSAPTFEAPRSVNQSLESFGFSRPVSPVHGMTGSHTNHTSYSL